MGGLLDKANEYSDSVHQGDNVGKKVVNEASAIIEAYEMGKESSAASGKKSKPKKESKPVADSEDDFEFDEIEGNRKLIFHIAGSLILLITLIGIFWFKYVNWLLVGSAIIVSWAIFNAEMALTKNINNTKLIATGVAWLLLSVAMTGATFTLGSSGVTITEIQYNEDDDKIRITMFGNSGSDIDVSIEMDGQLMCEDSTSISFDQITISFDVKDCWGGNSLDETATEVIDYVVIATSGDSTDSYGIPSAIMAREVNSGLVKIVEQTESVEGNTGNYNEYQGIQVELGVGIDDLTNSYSFSEGQFTGTSPWWISADWEATIEVYHGGTSNLVYTYDEIKANGGVASGYGEFNSDWVRIPANSGNFTLKDTDFYDSYGDGCYTFVVTIDNEISTSFEDSRSSIEFFWDENESDEDTTNDQPAESC